MIIQYHHDDYPRGDRFGPNNLRIPAFDSGCSASGGGRSDSLSL